MRAYGGVDIQVYVFLSSALVGSVKVEIDVCKLLFQNLRRVVLCLTSPSG
jgi:hypothetical protein